MRSKTTSLIFDNLSDIFETRNLNYNLRSQTYFIRTRVNTVLD